ncbi:helix-turn-helix transcriptional regulator [bacterium]|nr:helix-turn-helix transcriptional regulator [bacterium]
MRNIKQLLGLKVKELRKSRNLTQEQLAERVGIGTANISYIENGKFLPSVETLVKLSEIFEVYPYQLYMFEHLKPIEELKNELFAAMDRDDDLVRLMYRIFQGIR